MGKTSPQLLRALKLEKITPPTFFRSLKECSGTLPSHPYSHIMRRAWEAMELSGIYCIDDKPTIYFKEVSKFNPQEAQTLQKKLWNQGFAILLVISTKTEIHIYSGLVPPVHDESSQDKILVEKLNTIANALEINNFVQSVETGQFYKDNEGYFNPANTVDRYLLKNLKVARDRLKSCEGDWDYSTIHAILGRLIFTCYLIDREIIGSKHFADAGAPDARNLKELFNSGAQAKNILYKLFKSLHSVFNGNMFDENIQDEKKSITSGHIEILKRFFNAKDLEMEQFSLDFWAYDFSVIPIETISAIYEEFLGAENEKGKQKTGAYYTPKLLAETTVDIAIEGWNTLLDKKILDPACGSGIFLVILFNRMAEEWRFKHLNTGNKVKARELKKLLQNNLCGVDVKETACRVTCFSLYLAYLDQFSPRDIHDLEEKQAEKVLPNILALKGSESNLDEPPVIFEGNFFDPEVNIPKQFDLIIGNPPWVSRGKNTDTMAIDWCLAKDNPWADLAPKKKADKNLFFMPANQIANAFLWKTPLHLQLHGKACLLMPSKILLNETTNKFQEGWFKRFSVEKVVQLSDMRRILFKKAISPAIILRFNPKQFENRNCHIEYLIPKANRADPRKGSIVLFSDDYKRIKISTLIKKARNDEAPILWKKCFWGTPRDTQFLDRLLEMPRLGNIVGEIREEKRWIKGQGFIPDTKKKSASPKKPWWPKSHLFINAKSSAVKLFLLKEDCEKINNKFERLSRPRDPEIFKAPLLLVNQGFSKRAYSDFDVLFQDSLQSICGPEEDKDLLLFLTAVLNSNVATYFLFHTAANWGTERKKVHFTELMRHPFPLPEDTDDPSQSKSIINEISKKFKKLIAEFKGISIGKAEKVRNFQQDIEPLIYKYYGISEWERILIEDTINIFEPSSTPSSMKSRIPTLEPTSPDFRKKYANLLCQVLNSWAKSGKQRVSALTRFSSSLGYGVFTLTKSSKTMGYEEKKSDSEMNAVLERILKLLPNRTGGLSYLRGLKIFDGNMIHFVKPLTKRHWTKTSALNDADEIAAAILSGGKEK